jgi:hypothetical protein
MGLLSVPYQTLWEQAHLYVSACNIITHNPEDLSSSRNKTCMESTLNFGVHIRVFSSSVLYDFKYHIFGSCRHKLVLLRSQSHNRAILYVKLVFVGKKKKEKERTGKAILVIGGVGP